MPIFLALAVGLGILLVSSKKTGLAATPAAGKCPVTQDEINALWDAPLGPDGKVPAAGIAALRAMAKRLDGCGQKAQASSMRSMIFLVTQNPKDVLGTA